jgi:hypothetical protein
LDRLEDGQGRLVVRLDRLENGQGRLEVGLGGGSFACCCGLCSGDEDDEGGQT